MNKMWGTIEGKKIKEIRECDTIQKIILSDYGKLSKKDETIVFLFGRSLSYI